MVHDGIQLWVSKTVPFYHDGPLTLLKHLKVIASGPTYLIVKVEQPGWKCILVTGRAPHAGLPTTQGIQYWNCISAALRPFRSDMPIFFCGDTNGHLGSVPSVAVGDHAASLENAPGTVFHD